MKTAEPTHNPQANRPDGGAPFHDERQIADREDRDRGRDNAPSDNVPSDSGPEPVGAERGLADQEAEVLGDETYQDVDTDHHHDKFDETTLS